MVSVGFSLGAIPVAGAAYPFRLDAEQQGATHRLIAANTGHAPVTARIEVTGSNLAGIEGWPRVVVVPARSTIQIGQLAAASASAGYQFQFHYAFQIGNINTSTNPGTAYRLPYPDGQGYLVLQAPGGPVSTHTDRRSANAIDFDLPERTPVVAARDGVVVEVVTGHTFGRLDPALKGMDNHVTLAHADGSLSEYVHLRSGPYVVYEGQRVAAGTLLGYSGNTGYSSRPHLHFAVVKPVLSSEGKLEAESLPVRFGLAGGVPEAVVAGTIAHAGAPAPEGITRHDRTAERDSDQREPVARESASPGLGMASAPKETVSREEEFARDEQAAPRPVDAKPRVFLAVPAALDGIPVWAWGLLAIGLWMVAGGVARVVSPRRRYRRIEPRPHERMSDD